MDGVVISPRPVAGLLAAAAIVAAATVGCSGSSWPGGFAGPARRAAREGPITVGPDSATLTAAGAQTVDQVAGLLAPAAGIRVQITGHTATAPGDPAAAQRLAEHRAQSVATAMTGKGVAADRVQTTGATPDAAARPDPATARRVDLQLT